MTQRSAANGDKKHVSVSRTIAAGAADIFDILADPGRHHLIDGSGTVVAGASSNPERLSMGAKFGMSMRIVVPYRMSNEVVEFEENRRIAWRHLGHHVWRYELDPISDTETMVTETFDWGVARAPFFYEWVGYPERHKVNITATLERLAQVVE